MSPSPEDISWDELFASLVPDDEGRLASPTPLADLAARVHTLTSAASPSDRAALTPIVALLNHCERMERERAERDHKANNALAGVHANVGFLEAMLGRDSPDQPLARDASPEERAVLLQALRHTVQATRKLTEILKAPAVSKKT